MNYSMSDYCKENFTYDQLGFLFSIAETAVPKGVFAHHELRILQLDGYVYVYRITFMPNDEESEQIYRVPDVKFKDPFPKDFKDTVFVLSGENGDTDSLNMFGLDDFLEIQKEFFEKNPDALEELKNALN